MTYQIYLKQLQDIFIKSVQYRILVSSESPAVKGHQTLPDD